MSDFRIAVDLDGVLAEAMIVWCDLYNKRYGRALRFDDIRGWDVWEIVKIPRDEFFSLLDDAWLDWKRMPPTEEDVGKQVKLLREFGTVDIVTGRSGRTVSQAKEWLKAHAVQYDRFIRTESTLAKINLSYDVFIDDSPELMGLIVSSSTALGILYTRPWNRDAQVSTIVRRVYRWAEVPPIVRAVSTKPRTDTSLVSSRNFQKAQLEEPPGKGCEAARKRFFLSGGKDSALAFAELSHNPLYTIESLLRDSAARESSVS